MEDSTKDTIQVVVWIVAALGGIVAAFRAVIEMRRSREQRIVDHRWRQAKEAGSLVDEMRKDQLSRNAMTMLDWTGRMYDLGPGTRTSITYEEMYEALRTEYTSFSKKEVLVRDCFDNFLDHFERINFSIESGLTQPKDVLDPLRYYIAKMAKKKNVFEGFMREYEFLGALALVNRCKEWSDT